MNVYIFRNHIDLSFIEVFPGDWVVIKPNLVKEATERDPSEWESVITSPKLIEIVCEDICRKLAGKGKITICDAPQTDSSFSKIAELLDLHGLSKRYSEQYGIQVEILDLRNEEWVNEGGVISKRYKLPGDPNGCIKFDLGMNSLFYDHPGEGRYYGADYDAEVVNKHHRGEIQEYLICATPINADVFINLPKMKTHKKTGVTLSLKNLVGINANKNYLPHHTEGSPKNNGDQFPDFILKHWLENITVKLVRKLALSLPYLGPKVAQKLRKAGTVIFGNQDVIRSGNWYGNNTTWRMVLDLNRCFFYGNKDGTLRRDNPKRYYCLIDGIVGMEGLGPMQGDPVHSNVLVGGSDPVAVDMVAARVMGFNWRKIPMIREAIKPSTFPLTSIKPEEVFVVSDVSEWNGRFLDIEKKDFPNFNPPQGWKGSIEYEK